MAITEKIWERKLNEKYRYDVPNLSSVKKEQQPKTKREMHELQHKTKRCICGLHSVKAHKERWKYPKRKRKRVKRYE